jgi:hypothetical protein
MDPIIQALIEAERVILDTRATHGEIQAAISKVDGLNNATASAAIRLTAGEWHSPEHMNGSGMPQPEPSPKAKRLSTFLDRNR